MTLKQLLDETPTDAQARERLAFDSLLSAAGGQVVLFGAGVLGRKVLSALRNGGVEVVAYADNNASLYGLEIDRVPVMSLAAAIARWKQNALFVVTIFRPLGGEGMYARLSEFSKAGLHATSFLQAAWRFPGILPHFAADLPSRLLGHSEELRHVSDLWADDSSRQIFLQQLAWRLRADFSEPAVPVPDQYFPRELILPRADEQFVDGGAFDGDTYRKLGSFKHVWAIEPDPISSAILGEHIQDGVTLCQTALGSKPGIARFAATGTPASGRSTTGQANVRVSRLDDLLENADPTFIKLDVEGDELSALEGSTETLRRAQPLMAVCVYHRPEDIWTIPLFLHKHLPGHRLYLRCHEHDGFELVVYAVPKSRSVVA
jgi:FkbM family methyltransferase